MKIFIPLVSGFIYAISVFLLKRAMQNGVGIWRTTFVCNWAMTLCFLPMLLLGGQVPQGIAGMQPILAGTTFFLGQVFIFAALRSGDVSISTPMLGSKVILVAVFVTLFEHTRLPSVWWIAAFISSAALALLGVGPAEHRGSVLRTILFAFLAAVLFAITDALTQMWTPVWGVGYFIPIVFLVNGLLSFFFIPFFSAGLHKIPSETRPWLFYGSLLTAIQCLGVAYAIGVFGAAPAINVVYSSRGVWSVIFVFLIPHWFDSNEGKIGKGFLLCRLIGATLICTAIALVVKS